MQRRHPLVVNADEIPPFEGKDAFPSFPDGAGFGFRARRLAAAAGATQLGCTLYEVEPGKTAFPCHWHLSNEEAILVIAGTGSLRLGDAEVAVRAGDYVALPVGKDHAHQLVATGTETLRYYCISTMKDPEVAGYPDSRKIAFLSRRQGQPLRAIFYEEDARAYFDREPRASR
jgi:uncharacterized cupin superfamily protein